MIRRPVETGRKNYTKVVQTLDNSRFYALWSYLTQRIEFGMSKRNVVLRRAERTVLWQWFSESRTFGAEASSSGRPEVRGSRTDVDSKSEVWFLSKSSEVWSLPSYHHVLSGLTEKNFPFI